MESWEIGLAGLCGIVSWAFISLVLRRSKQQRAARPLAAIPLAGLLFVLVQPHLGAKASPHRAERKPHTPAPAPINKPPSPINRLFRLIGTRHPEVNVDFRAVEAEARRTGRDVEVAKREAERVGLQTYAKLLEQYLPTASDEAVVAFATAFAGALRNLQKLPDDSCARYVRQDLNRPVSFEDSPEGDRIYEAAYLVFESAFNHPVVPPSDAELGEAFEAWLKYLFEKRGERYFEDAEKATAELPLDAEQGHRFCAVLIDAYEDALNAPRERVKVLRALLSPNVGTDSKPGRH